MVVTIIKKITAEMMGGNRLLIPPAKLLNRGGWPLEGGGLFLERKVSFLCYENLRDHFCCEVSKCYAVEVDILCYILSFFIFEC